MKRFILRFKGTLVLGIFLAFLVITIVPVVSFLSPKFLLSRHLILFTNEAEARPCGGFLTAYGEMQVFPPKFFLKNSYAMGDVSFGDSQEPLASLNSEQKFWDLGISPNLSECTKQFRESYQEKRFNGKEMGSAILVDFKMVEQVLSIMGPIKLGEEKITSENIFAYLTRTVANVDRHDEKSLAERKTPLADLGKRIIQKTLLRPWKWTQLTRLVRDKIDSGELFVEGLSPEFKSTPEDFAVIEWNLGGAKTSRFLQKKLTLTFREVFPQKWEGVGHFSVRNVGIFDEPLAQTWKGTFEFRFPEMLQAETEFFSGVLVPGSDAFEKEFKFQFQGDFNEISVFQPRGQEIFSDITVTTYPQQSIASSVLRTHENIGHFFGVLKSGRNIFPWSSKKDTHRPFVTMHEIISLESLSDEVKSNFEPYLSTGKWELSIAEIHFNESVVISPEAVISITDKDFENKDITDQPEMKHITLFPDQRTAVIGFWRDGEQERERFTLKLSGIQDLWGNEISDQEYTLMIR